MPDTQTSQPYSPDEIAEYLGDVLVTDDHDLSTIATCLRVISRHPVGDDNRDAEMIEAAVECIASWLQDNGVSIDIADID